MQAGTRVKVAEKKGKSTGKRPPLAKNSIRVSISPVYSAVPSPLKILRTIKSSKNICFSPKKSEKSGKSPEAVFGTQISIKSIEKKVNFSKNESDEPSPIIVKHSKGFSMTEEELKDLRLMLRNLNKK